MAGSLVDAPDLEAQLLAAHVLMVDRPWLIAHGEDPFPELAGEAVLAARLSGKPLAYILQHREFYGRRFFVGPGVLIPRQETETLIEAALRRLGPGTARILDLGTGSGCLAISLKLERPLWHVIGSDRSKAAIEIAQRNAIDLGAEIEWVVADGITPFNDRAFDLIVTNPPYVGSGETLPPEIANFEPREALYSGPTGLEFYALLATEAADCLASRGEIAMELGNRQGPAVRRLFEDKGWTIEGLVNDLSGVARVQICRRPSVA